MTIYLDNSATTRCYKEVGDTVRRVLCDDYGNPSSLHRKGLEAEHEIRKSREILARTLRVKEKEILFTSGGTESDNLAIIGCARANHRRGNHLITTSIEHPAVLQAMHRLEEEGYRVTYLPVDGRGCVRIADLKQALCKETILVSMMYVNNEVGSRQPIEEAARMIHQEYPGTLFHVDGVQAFGKYRIYPSRMGVDLFSVSGHKIHGPKGVGVLYVRQGVKMQPLLFGGGQQNDFRPGTENVPGIAGIGQATELIYKDLESKVERLRLLKEKLARGILSIPDTRINGFSKEVQQAGDAEAIKEYGAWGAPHIVSAGFAGIRSEVLLHDLEDKEICVSSGSACASNHPAISGVLKGMGTPGEYLDATLRFSMSEFTTSEEIDETLNVLYNDIPVFRRYTRR